VKPLSHPKSWRDGALAVVWQRLRRCQRQQGVHAADIDGFAGSIGGYRSVRLRQPMLLFRYLLFAVFVEGIHDIVQALVDDLPLAPYHRHRFPSAQILGQINQNTTQRQQLEAA
jgi:hypothetical protein